MTSQAASALSNQLDLIRESLYLIFPEIALVVTFLILVVLGMFRSMRSTPAFPILFISGLSVALGFAIRQVMNPESASAFLNMLQVDAFGGYAKVLVYLSGIVIGVVGFLSEEIRANREGNAEYWILLSAMSIGLSFMAMASHLMMIILALEMVSIPSYLLTANIKRKSGASEGALKYLVFGAVASGITIYAASWIYGITGTLDPQSPGFAEAFSHAGLVTNVLIPVLFLSGFLFKVSAVPFHFWAPDVYQSAPYPIAAFFTTAPKIAGFALLARFLTGSGWVYEPFIWGKLSVFIGLAAIFSMVLGNFSALSSDNLKRLLAYSGIAHSGYLLLALYSSSQNGLAALLFYLSIYAAMNLGMFLFAGFIEERVSKGDLSIISSIRQPFTAILVILFLVALTGLPPTGGFTAKFYLFGSLISGDPGPFSWSLLIIAIINTVIGLFYYLRPAVQLVMRKPVEKFTFRLQTWQYLCLTFLALPVLWLGILHFGRFYTFLSSLVVALNG